MTRTWYRVALARDGQPTSLVAAAGEHLGIAIAAAQHQLANSWPVAADIATDGVAPLGESVGKGQVVELGAAAADAPTFRWPPGAIPQLGTAGVLAGARRGWIARTHPKLRVIEAQPDAAGVVDTFLGVIERLPSADNLEVRVMDHFEDAKTTDVWLTSRIDARKILKFLDEQDELIASGMVEIGIYVRAHKATLRLTEHKTIVWLAEGNGLVDEIGTWLGELGVPHADVLPTVADAPHFHYRPAKSRDRKKLGEELYRQRLRQVDRVKRG